MPDEIWALAVVKQEEGCNRVFALMFDSVVDNVTVENTHKMLKTFIVGKDWDLEDTDEYIFLESEEDFYKRLLETTEINILEKQ